MQYYLFDERENDNQVICNHCNKKINGSKYYILQTELYNESNMLIIGSGCVKKFTGQTVKEIKAATHEAMRSRLNRL